jgi:hypothetical protein
MSENIEPYMRWHAKGRTKDGVLRHPANGEAWKSFDLLHPNLSMDTRNVRLGLTSDGFNPFGNMSTSHSISFILTLVILGLSSPNMDLDVYLQPLIDELQELRNVGVHTFYASKKNNFVM